MACRSHVPILVFEVLGLVEDLVHYLIRPAGVRTSRAREEIHEVAIAYGNYNILT